MESVPPKVVVHRARRFTWLAIAEKPSDLARETWHLGENMRFKNARCSRSRQTIQFPPNLRGPFGANIARSGWGQNCRTISAAMMRLSVVFTSEPAHTRSATSSARRRVTLTLSRRHCRRAKSPCACSTFNPTAPARASLMGCSTSRIAISHANPPAR